jgi:hypothetical protein
MDICQKVRLLCFRKTVGFFINEKSAVTLSYLSSRIQRIAPEIRCTPLYLKYSTPTACNFPFPLTESLRPSIVTTTSSLIQSKRMDSRAPVRREEQRACACAIEELKASPETPPGIINVAAERRSTARAGSVSGGCF